MAVCYKKLWKLLIDKDMKKRDLHKATGLSAPVIARMGKGQNVSTASLRRICEALDCDLSDIVDFVKDEE